MPPLMRALEMIGSDVDNFECPRCGAHDRERHLLLYLQSSGLLASLPSLRILHFAPEWNLSRRIAEMVPVQYVKCDLYPGTADVQRVDIQAMPYADATFDMVIANHVLEHVGDDLKAVSEVARVLKDARDHRAIRCCASRADRVAACRSLHELVVDAVGLPTRRMTELDQLRHATRRRERGA